MLAAEALSYRYPSVSETALHPTSLSFHPGTFTLLTGPTGCGKSTLLRLIGGLLQRHGGGQAAGSSVLDGRDLASAAPAERVKQLGFVAQNPDDQLVAGTVGDEIAFGAESAGFAADEIAARVAELGLRLGLPDDLDRPVRALSGGQRQRLVLAAAMSGGGQVLLLDEPLAHLDPVGAAELVVHLRELANLGHTVLVVEHRLEAVFAAADRVVVMDKGRVVSDGPGAALNADMLRSLGLVVPVDLALSESRGAKPDVVPTQCAPGGAKAASPAGVAGQAVVARSSPFIHHYSGMPAAMQAPALAFTAGERIAIVGPNGAGKSTLLGVLTGEIGESRLVCDGRVVAVPQDPDLALFCATVREELEYGPGEFGIAGNTGALAAAFSLLDLLDRPPQAISRGQRLRTAVAAALAAQPSLLALDEPTAGQDFDQVERLFAALRLQLAGGVLLFATHDLALAVRHATRVLVVSEGAIIADGNAALVLDEPEIARLLPLPGALGRCRARGISLAELMHRGGPGSALDLLREAR